MIYSICGKHSLLLQLLQTPQHIKRAVPLRGYSTWCGSHVVFTPNCLCKSCRQDAASWECLICPPFFLPIKTRLDILLWLSTPSFMASCKMCGHIAQAAHPLLCPTAQTSFADPCRRTPALLCMQYCPFHVEVFISPLSR